MSALDVNAADHEPLKPIESIKARTDIVDIVGRYADLKKRGKALWAKCPLHVDATPSFKVNEQLQAYMCFGCGAKGDVFDFIMAAEYIALAAAIERVLELVGGGAPPRLPRRPRTRPEAPPWPGRSSPSPSR